MNRLEYRAGLEAITLALVHFQRAESAPAVLDALIRAKALALKTDLADRFERAAAVEAFVCGRPSEAQG